MKRIGSFMASRARTLKFDNNNEGGLSSSPTIPRLRVDTTAPNGEADLEGTQATRAQGTGPTPSPASAPLVKTAGGVSGLIPGGGGGTGLQGRRGWLQKKRPVGWLKRYFVLEGTVLSYFGSEDDMFPLGFIPLHDAKSVRVVPEKDRGRRFELELSSRLMVLLADTADDAAGWVNALEAARRDAGDFSVVATTTAVGGRPSTSEEPSKGGVVELESMDPEWAEEGDDAGENDALSSDFRVSFYRAALGHPALMERLMSDFRTNEQVLRLCLQVLRDPSGGDPRFYEEILSADGMMLGPDMGTIVLGPGPGATLRRPLISPSTKSPTSRSGAATEWPASGSEQAHQLEEARQWAACCSRLNRDCHRTTTVRYLRGTQIDVSRLPDAAADVPESRAGASSVLSATITPRAPVQSVGFRLPSPGAMSPSPAPSPSPSPSAAGGSRPAPPPALTRQGSGGLGASLCVPGGRNPGGRHQRGSSTMSGKGDNTSTQSPKTLPLPASAGGQHVRSASNYRHNEIYSHLSDMPGGAAGGAGGAGQRATAQGQAGLGIGRGRSKDDLAVKLSGADPSQARGAEYILSAPGYSSLPVEDRQALYGWVLSDEFILQAAHLFAAPDIVVHRLVLRAVWVVLQRSAHYHLAPKPPSQADNWSRDCSACDSAADHMALFISKVLRGYCPPKRRAAVVTSVTGALLSLLFTDATAQPTSSSSSGAPVRSATYGSGGGGIGGGGGRAFNLTGGAGGRRGSMQLLSSEVRNHGVWKALFVAMAEGEFRTRRKALKDINSALIARTSNIESLLVHPHWQQWILPLLLDVPADVASNRALVRTYVYTVNIFTMLHHHAFLRYKDPSPVGFRTVMVRSLCAPLHAPQGRQVAAPAALMRAFLDSLMRKLRNQRNVFAHHDEECVTWTNLEVLLQLTRRFLFCTTPRHLSDAVEHTDLFDLGQEPQVLGVRSDEDEVAQDVALVESVLACLEAAKAGLDPSVDVSDMRPDERQAWGRLVTDDAMALAQDTFVVLPMLSKLRLSAGEVSDLVRDFLKQTSPEKRRKVFQAAADRNRTVVEEQRSSEKRLSGLIEKQLRKSEEQSKQVKSILLLGAGESGKSTVFKQFQNVYGKGFTPAQRRNYVAVVHRNILRAARTLIRQSEVLSMPDALGGPVPGCAIRSPATLAAAAALEMVDESATLTPTLAEHIRTLWNDDAIRITLHLRSRYQLDCGDSVRYFFDKINEIVSPEYVPTFDDMLRSRNRTTGAEEAHLEIDGVPFRVTDVGGQRNERKKWIHQFQDVTAVLFVAALSEYDQTLAEDESMNRLTEAIQLFGETCRQPVFLSTPIILFLNKCDLFARKLQHVQLADHFPAFSQYKNDYRTACAFVRREFMRQNTSKTREIFCHITCATDTQQLRIVFESVKGIVINQALASAGLAPE